MQLKIDLKICAVLLIFFLTNQLEVYVLFMLFTIIHELGHLFIGIILGFKPKGIKLMPMGLSICFNVQCEDYNMNVKKARIITLKKLLIALAGPLTNFLIAVFFMIYNIEILNITGEKIVYANLLIGFFNLIPIYPLDGGRIVKCVIHIKKNLRKSYRYTNLISNIMLIAITAISSIAILYFENIAILMVVIYLWMLAIKENHIYNKKMQLYELIDNLEGAKEIVNNV